MGRVVGIRALLQGVEGTTGEGKGWPVQPTPARCFTGTRDEVQLETEVK